MGLVRIPAVLFVKEGRMAKKSSGKGKVDRSRKSGRFITQKDGKADKGSASSSVSDKKGGDDDPPRTTKGR